MPSRKAALRCRWGKGSRESQSDISGDKVIQAEKEVETSGPGCPRASKEASVAVAMGRGSSGDEVRGVGQVPDVGPRSL